MTERLHHGCNHTLHAHVVLRQSWGRLQGASPMRVRLD
jgi:hypothetical protein